MAEVKRVSPAEAQELVDVQGYTYVDVRSVPEFEAEHPTGAVNLPLMHMAGSGMSPNGEFLAVMQRAFPKDAKLVVGCKAGGRSLRAAQLMMQAGYTNVIDQRAGFDAARDAFGQVIEPGWKAAGLPTEKGEGGERAWAAMQKR